MTLISLILGGIVTGLYGSTAGGGGIVSFPLLILLGYSAPAAVATNRFAAVILESVSALRFFREGALVPHDLKLGLLLGITAAIGAALGSYVAISIPVAILNIITGAFLLAMTCYLLLKRPTPALTQRTLTPARLGFLHLATFFLGIYGGVLGAGMGTIFAVLLVGSGLSYVEASAVSRLSGIIWSVSATFVFALNNAIDWSGGLALGSGFAIGGWIGAGWGAKKGERYIRVLLLLVIAASIAKLVVQAVG